MKNTFLIPLFCLAALGSIQAQRDETLFGRNGFDLSGAWGSALYNYSFFEEDYVYTRGGSVGLEFGNNYFLGYGWSRFREDANVKGLPGFDLKYNGFILGIAPNSHKAIHPRLSMLTGGGRVRLDDGASDRVFVFQPSLGLEINVFRWFRFGAEGGYRLIANENFSGLEASDISSPFVQLDLRFGYSWGR